ncbi:E3 ubiquitin-protein ligase TRIM39-like [Pleurodeles waltl]|uniref:E3 ubiquitin-protein ligase TRIM39-like n=1 Tax=Pleurodeles waltl TaxID=8319 RepID=UPI00370990A3
MMISECGHNFCRSCITQNWEGRDENFPCPRCRETSSEGNLRPNWQLGNMVEIAKQLHLPPVKPPEENLCEEHEEKLRLFCAEDQRMICVVCRESKEHKTHSVTPVEETAEEYKVRLWVFRDHKVTLSPIEERDKQNKVKLQEWLRLLKKEEEHLLESKVKQDEHNKTLWNKLRTEKNKIEFEFEKLQQLLKENKQTLREKLEEMEKKMTMVENANINKLTNQITSLNVLIMEIEKKCEESGRELLKVLHMILIRDYMREARFPQMFPSQSLGLEQPLQIEEILLAIQQMGCGKTLNYDGLPVEFYATFRTVLAPQQLETHQEAHRGGLLPSSLREALIVVPSKPVMVTLDPDTAHPRLLLSDGGRRVRRRVTAQRLPETPKRFTSCVCVLGSEGFTSGRHYWEVQLLQEWGAWHVGVAAESMNRKGKITWSPEMGVWAVGGSNDHYKAFTSPPAPLSPREKPLKLGVYLDYEGWRLSLYNAASMELLYTFPQAPFTERLFPCFWLGRGVELRLV